MQCSPDPSGSNFGNGPASLGNYPSDTNSQIAATLTQLRAMTLRWLAGDWTASNRDFELRLSELRAGDGGALLMAYSQVQRTLDRANQLISQVTGEETLCPYGQPTERSRAVEQIVAKYFAGGVQPWLVALRQRQELLLPPIQSLEGALEPSLSPPYDQWRRQRDQLPAGATATDQRPRSGDSAGAGRLPLSQYPRNPRVSSRTLHSYARRTSILQRRWGDRWRDWLAGERHHRHWHALPTLLH